MSDTKEAPPPEYSGKHLNDGTPRSLPTGVAISSTTGSPTTAPVRSATAIIAAHFHDTAVSRLEAVGVETILLPEKILTSVDIAVKITDTNTRIDVIKKILERLEKRFTDLMPTLGNLYMRLNLLFESKNIRIDDEVSWEPCRDLLMEGKGTLEFRFGRVRRKEVETSGRADDKKRGAKCQVQ